jgi:hypothetical protein
MRMRLPWRRDLSAPEATVLGQIHEARGMPADDVLIVDNRSLIDRFEQRNWVTWLDRGEGPRLYMTNDGGLALGRALGVDL